jgi:GH25 family lysozyme M1 (1,4-beta-N-acetylmuramidase)
VHLVDTHYVFGLDLSHYQGNIDWCDLSDSEHPIEYVFLRATMGVDGVDLQFQENWRKAKKHQFLRGAYHYYRPHENSEKQFTNFKAQVKLEAGDFMPVLDIEEKSRYGAENLRAGILNWLQLAEAEYGVKPMIYTGLSFYEQVLQGHIPDDYPLWIAAYSGKHRVEGVEWTFHQFTEEMIVNGISTKVDGNDFNGTREELRKLLQP